MTSMIIASIEPINVMIFGRMMTLSKRWIKHRCAHLCIVKLHRFMQPKIKKTNNFIGISITLHWLEVFRTCS